MSLVLMVVLVVGVWVLLPVSLSIFAGMEMLGLGILGVMSLCLSLVVIMAVLMVSAMVVRLVGGVI